MITRKHFLKILTTAVMALALLATGSYVSAKKGGNGGNGNGGGEDPPPAELPPVRYQIQFFDLPFQGSADLEINGTNSSGQAVGRIYHDVDGSSTYSAVLYDPQRDLTSAIDLNTIVAGIPEGWKLRYATAINFRGDISAYLIKNNEPTKILQAAMIDMNAVDPETGESRPQLHIIPDAGFSNDETYSNDMNDVGDIVARFKRDDGTFGAYVYNFGLYDPSLKTETPIDLGLTVGIWVKINNPTVERDAQVVGILIVDESTAMPFRDTLGGSFETFQYILDESTGNVALLISPSDVNDAGEFCSVALITYPKKIKGSTGEFRGYVQGSSLETFATGTAYRLNESSDFITSDFNLMDGGELYHRSYIEGGGALLVSDLLDPTDSDSVTWEETVSSYILGGISDRDVITDFPKLFGEATFVDGSTAGFVLTPVLYP